MDSQLKAALSRSRAKLVGVLDGKLKDVPEWQAFRAVDDALQAVVHNAEQEAERTAARGASAANGSGQLSYVELGLQALNERGRPQPTPDMIEYIGARRELPQDPDRAKINVSSAFSHDDRLQSVPWQGGRAWWYANRPVPRDSAT
jgi:hypothetical protein